MSNIIVKIIKEFNRDNNSMDVKVIIEGDLNLLIKANEYLYNIGKARKKFNIMNNKIVANIPDTLKCLFENHKQFYEYIGLEHTNNYHPDDSDFNESCWGFSDFMRYYFGVERWVDLDKEHMETLKDIITKRIKDIIKIYEKSLNTRIIVKSELLFTPETTEQAEEERIELDELNIILQDAIIITNDNAFKINIVPIKQKTFNELINDATKTLKKIYEAQVNAKVKALEEEIQKLREEIEKVKTDAFIEGLKCFEELKKIGWQLKNGKLYYKKIVSTHVKYKGRIYKLPKKYIDEQKFYVKGITIEINKTVNTAKCSSAYHCNCDNNSICLGDLEGKDLLTVATKLPEALKILNLDSAYSNDAKDELEAIISELEEEEAITEIWTT